MLEVKNLQRVYKPKKGTPVVALNKVSLKFPDNGLIFVLGKSGSGKSTLLNVMGGLDKADSGEIVIKGKSSANFKQGDFDSYRNTYLGFIFQEYNILDEFNVGQNIALAIELQGRKATNEEINKILEEVDLKGYGNRKPNELSGGQKQRVAIARALVKNPEIIFADEPTGALDSKTGMAVFETLKKLSKDKLVVVVSHDREFAEMYGDRVIELADGNVISDIEKVTSSGDVKTSGITIIDEKVIKIKKDYTLTKEDMEIIRKYLNSSTDERLISLDGSINESVRHIARIDEEGNKETFKKTDETAIYNKPGTFSSIRSKLSLKNCFRIGGSSLKVKPFRLVITVFLAIIAFGMFGLADTMGSYEKVNATIKSIEDANYSSLVFEANAASKQGYYTYVQRVNSDAEDIKIIEEKYGIDVEGVYAIDPSGHYEISISNFLTQENVQYNYYSRTLSGLYVSSLDDIAKKGFTILAGSYPALENEVAITKHTYDSFAKYGYTNNQTNINITSEEMSYNNIIGKVLNFYIDGQQAAFKITAIIDTHFDKSGYDKLKNPNSSGAMDIGLYMLSNQYKVDCNYGYNTLLFTNNDTITNKKNNITTPIIGNCFTTIGDNTNHYSYAKKYLPSSNVIMLNDKTSLNKKECIIGLSEVNRIVGMNYQEFQDKKITPVTINLYGYEITIENLCDVVNHMEYTQYCFDFAYNNYDKAIMNNMDMSEIYFSIYRQEYPADSTREDNISYYAEYIEGIANKYIQGETYAGISFEEYYINKIKEYFGPYIDELINAFPEIQLTLSSYDDITKAETYIYDSAQCEVVGIEFNTEYYTQNCYFDDETFSLLIANKNGDFSYLICPMTEDRALLRKIIEDTYSNENDADSRFYKMQNGIMPAFESINTTIEQMAQIFLWVGVGFAIFASLMLFNFITISISYKKREIGILRAVGARSNDVFNIFFAESFIIAMISYAFAIIATFAVSMVVNTSLKSEFNLAITLLSPGIRQIVLVLVVCVFVAIISTFLPVYKIAMKRPIDAIQNR